jgi:HD domain/Peptidase family S58
VCANGSGDIFIAFSTANPGAAVRKGTRTLAMLPNDQLGSLFLATVEATEEAIVNAMVAARTMGELRVAHRPGAQGRTLGPEEEAAALVGDEWMNDAERQEFHPHFQRALSFATSLHASQTRKGTDIPYISHLLAVAGLVLECGGGRDEAIAGLLHDSIEDCGPKYPGGVTALREVLESEFGPTVLQIVEGCTDADTHPKPPYRERKERYIAHIRSTSPAVRLVSCADKLHNARAIVADLRALGNALFDRFNGGRDGPLWYYDTLATEFEQGGPQALAAELRRAVDNMKALASGSQHE